MSDETDEAGNLAPTMTQAELTEIGKAESWETHLGQEYGVDIFAFRLKGQRKDTPKLVGPRARDLGEWCNRLMQLR
jgi:hypothetical protein